MPFEKCSTIYRPGAAWVLDASNANKRTQNGNKIPNWKVTCVFLNIGLLKLLLPWTIQILQNYWNSKLKPYIFVLRNIWHVTMSLLSENETLLCILWDVHKCTIEVYSGENLSFLTLNRWRGLSVAQTVAWRLRDCSNFGTPIWTHICLVWEKFKSSTTWLTWHIYHNSFKRNYSSILS
jgi:hypothetical protein